MNNLEKEMIETRDERNLQQGAGAELLLQVESRDNLQAQDEGLKYYRRKGISAISGFDYAQMYQDGFDPLSRDDNTSLVPNSYAKPKQRTMFGYDPSTGERVDSLPHEGSIWGSMPRVVVGAGYDIVRGTAGLIEDVADPDIPAGQDITRGPRQALLTSDEPKWLQESAGWGEDIVRDIAQFGVGYAAAYKTLGEMSLKSFLAKDVTASIAAGQTFDPAEGSLGTLLNEFDMLPDTMKWLDAKMTTEEEGRFQGRLAMALEETGIGAGFASIRAANQIRKGIKARYKESGNIMLKQGVQDYYNATSTITHPSLGLRGDEIHNQEAATAALNKIAGGFQMTGGSVDDFMMLANQANIPEKQVKKAWNEAAKEKLGRVTEFMDPGPTTPRQRQSGHITPFEEIGEPATPGVSAAAETLRPDYRYDVDSIEKFYKKQIRRGNIQSAEWKEQIQPAVEFLKRRGINNITGEQMTRYMDATQPKFRTVTKTETNPYSPAEHGAYQYDPRIGETQIGPGGVVTSNMNTPANVPDFENATVSDYKEHLFIARNEEDAGVFINEAHFSEPFVKGFARVSNLENSSSGRNSILIQELQSDSASAARKYGTWEDAEINTFLDKFKQEGNVTLSAKERKLFDEIMPDSDGPVGGETVAYFHEVRQILATPSAFNEDKAWVRQVMRPVVEDAFRTGSDEIVLASSDIIKSRYSGTGAEDLYQNKYPKILRQYFKDIGVPDAMIHMPSNSNESFWVELPKEMMEAPAPSLPAYSVGGAAPMAIGFGEENGD